MARLESDPFGNPVKLFQDQHAADLYCLRFFSPLPKGRLCYNDNLN